MRSRDVGEAPNEREVVIGSAKAPSAEELNRSRRPAPATHARRRRSDRAHQTNWRRFAATIAATPTTPPGHHAPSRHSTQVHRRSVSERQPSPCRSLGRSARCTNANDRAVLPTVGSSASTTRPNVLRILSEATRNCDADIRSAGPEPSCGRYPAGLRRAFKSRGNDGYADDRGHGKVRGQI